MMAVEFHHTDISKIQGHVLNWDELPEKVKKVILEAKEFSISYDGEDLLVYTKGALSVICSISENQNGKVSIYNCSNMGGKLIWEQ